MATQWEYLSLKCPAGGFAGGKVDLHDFDRRLNELGAQGWELVTAFDTNQSYGATRDVIAVFKRPRGS
jgi:hypothetical protein